MINVCLFANALFYPEGGGHLWVYLNWALGLRSAGANVIWLEEVAPSISGQQLERALAALRIHLQPYGFANSIALCSSTQRPLSRDYIANVNLVPLREAMDADLLLNMDYSGSREFVRAFRRSALLDIDPGLLQTWISSNALSVAPHDAYFTIGETVGRPGSRVPDLGIHWNYTPPAVSLEHWPPHSSAPDAAFTTVAHWWASDAEPGPDGQYYENGKREGFLPYLDLPRRVAQPLELALDISDSDVETAQLRKQGWRVSCAHNVASSPWLYQRYIQNSLGEFSCAKPSCIALQNAWISDRTICYLASGKPAIVEHTGPSAFLPDHAGIFRFHTPEEARLCIESVASDYERQCRLARQLAETYFDAKKVADSVLDRALGGQSCSSTVRNYRSREVAL